MHLDICIFLHYIFACIYILVHLSIYHINFQYILHVIIVFTPLLFPYIKFVDPCVFPTLIFIFNIPYTSSYVILIFPYLTFAYQHNLLHLCCISIALSKYSKTFPARTDLFKRIQTLFFTQFFPNHLHYESYKLSLFHFF